MSPEPFVESKAQTPKLKTSILKPETFISNSKASFLRPKILNWMPESPPKAQDKNWQQVDARGSGQMPPAQVQILFSNMFGKFISGYLNILLSAYFWCPFEGTMNTSHGSGE